MSSTRRHGAQRVPSDQPQSEAAVKQGGTPTGTPNTGRALRARRSEQHAPPPSSSSVTRTVSKDEMEKALQKLGPEGISSRRGEILREREAELRTVVDDHDMAVKEKFHLERYISILEGWDPAEARSDNSPVFLDYKNLHYNLLELVPSTSAAVAGPSRARATGPSRTTRRQLHAKTEALGIANGESAMQSGKGKGKVEDSGGVSSEHGRSGRRSHGAEGSMPPPPLPSKGKKSRRATIQVPEPEDHDIEEEEEDVPIKGKKRARQSLPSLPSKKARALRESATVASSSPASSPAPTRSPSPTPVQEPELPSLAHLEFPPPPIRPTWRRVGPSRITYTDPTQKPLQTPKYGGDIASILDSYIHIEDTGPPVDLPALELRAAREGYLRNRVNWLQHQGRLLRLLDEEDPLNTGPVPRDRSHRKQAPTGPPARVTDFHDSLMTHMVQVRNAMLGEAKAKPLVCKRIARMIQLYWEHLQNKDERERLAQEREIKRKSKEVVKALRKRWGLAVKVIRAKVVAQQKLEQDRLGKEHLQNMLQRSTGLLEAQRDDFVGASSEAPASEDSDDLDDSDDSDDSDATDAVSAAEDSEAEEEAEEEVEDDLAGDAGSEAGSEDSGSEDNDEAGAALRALVEGEEIGEEAEATATVVEDAAADDAGVDQLPSTIPEAPPQLPNTNGNVGHSAQAHPGPDTNTQPSPDEDLPPPRAPSRRILKRVSVANKAAATPDPDAEDVEFAENDSARDDQDAQMDIEMEDAGAADGGDSEDEGLLADANMPIEELLKRYGYEMPGTASDEQPSHQPSDTAEISVEVDGTLDATDTNVEAMVVDTTDSVPPQPATADGEPTTSGPLPDQSLTNSALEAREPSPALVIEGKRQRRVRTVWSPDNLPQSLPSRPKKPKIEQVEPEPESEKESTPEFTSSEEETDSDSDEAEDEGGAESEPEDPDAPRIKPPFLLRGTLRPYQHAGLEWLASLYTNNMNGILADEMGLGKTIQTISLLGHLACDRGVWGPHLIIVPTSVILNWEMEFKRFLPGMKVLTYYGNQKERKEKRRGWNTENAWQVCITSYQIVLADQHIFRRKNWVYMILDEAHNIKNFRSQRWQTLLGFKAQRRLLLTGTPLQNNLMELWSLLYFLMPNGITADATAVVGFANHKEFTEWFSNPMDKAVEGGDQFDEETIETVQKLHTLLRPFILRRLKSEVETQLPGKFEHVVYCRLSKRQRFLYDEFMSRASTRDALSGGGYLGVVNVLMQLRKVCNHPDLFEVRPVRTSFAMDKGVVSDYEPTELLVRKRLLAAADDAFSLDSLSLRITQRESDSGWVASKRSQLDASDKLPYAIEPVKKPRTQPPKADFWTPEGWAKYIEHKNHEASVARWRALRDVNRIRCQAGPIYGSTTLSMLSDLPRLLLPQTCNVRRQTDMFGEFAPPAAPLVHSLVDRLAQIEPVIDRFAVIPPNAVSRDVARQALAGVDETHPTLLDPSFDTLHSPTVRLQIAFPDNSLLQYDCGKLQKLYEMLRDLKAGGHRVLIFTQMTRVLDILEIFLSYNGHRYLRLDGSTKIEDRQIITERFNSDPRIFCFIASSRSGGVGINLTGADTVFFYDSDWNPSMDRQCMDRAHRIGQTREVHIYRFVSSHTVEENMLKKANQKRLLDRVVIQDGDFTTEFFGKMDWRDMLDEDMKATDEQDGIEDVEVEAEPQAGDVEASAPRMGQEREFAAALAEVEDEEDVVAAQVAQGEGELDFAEFDERKAPAPAPAAKSQSATATPAPAPRMSTEEGTPMEDEYDDDDVGGVDEYMLSFVEWDWEYFSQL